MTDPVLAHQVWHRGNARYLWFEDVDSIIDIVRKPVNVWDEHYPWHKGSQGWAGTSSMEDAIHHFQFGWEEVAEAVFIQDAALAIPREVSPEFTVFHEVCGAAVDIGAFLAGEPECMLDYRYEQRRRKTVKILFNVCNSGSTARNHIVERGKTVTSICDWLERSGYRVRIDIADTAYGHSHNHWTLAFCAKDFAQPLDAGRIGFMMGSPAMLRRIFFGVESSSPTWGREFYSYGYVAPVHKDIGIDYDYVFDYNTPINIQSASKCIEYILTGKATQKDITGGQDLANW